MSNIRQCGRIGCDKDDNHTSPHTYEDAIPSSAKRSAAEARIHEESKSSKRKDCSVRFYWCKGEESDTERPVLEVSQIENLDTLKGAVSCAWVENVIPTLMESNYNSISKALGHFMQANNIQLGSTGYYPNKKHVLCVNKSGDPDRLGNYIDNGKMKEFLTRFTSPAPTLAPSYRIETVEFAAYIYLGCKASLIGEDRPKLGLSAVLLENIKNNHWKGDCGWVNTVSSEFIGRVYSTVASAQRDLLSSASSGINCKLSFFIEQTESKQKVLGNESLIELASRPSSPIGYPLDDDSASETCTVGSIDYNAIEDEYYTEAKRDHRTRFANCCADEKDKGNGILILETRWGGATQALLNAGFAQSDIYACNNCENDPGALDALHLKFPNVNCVKDDIVKFAMTREWLGIWYDMECTWTKNGEWNSDRIPARFDNAYVVAISLSCRNCGGTYLEHAVDLTKLLTDLKRTSSQKGGFCSQDASLYVGRGGERNMVFGLAKYNRRMLHQPEDYIGVNLMIPFEIFKGKYQNDSWIQGYAFNDNHLFASVVSFSGDSFQVRFYDRSSFLIKECEDWEPTLDQVRMYKHSLM